MNPPRRLRPLPLERLRQLSEARLLAYRKQALSLENNPEESDYDRADIVKLDTTYIWFKSDPRWSRLYEEILRALAEVQRSS